MKLKQVKHLQKRSCPACCGWWFDSSIVVELERQPDAISINTALVVSGNGKIVRDLVIFYVVPTMILYCVLTNRATSRKAAERERGQITMASRRLGLLGGVFAPPYQARRWPR